VNRSCARRPSLPLLLVAIAACTSAFLAWRAAPTLARSSRVSACAARANGVRLACAGSARSTRAHGTAKRHHKKSSINSKKKRKKPSGSTAHALAPALSRAACEDGSTPSLGEEGAYECADGDEPACSNGGEPVSRHGALPVCPAPTRPGASDESNDESSEPGCDDFSAPALTEGSYACEDGSPPECEGGFLAAPGVEGSPPSCPPPLVNPTPAPAGEPGEPGEEDNSESSFDSSSARVAIGS
jgi:hypothetical protein